MIETSGHHPLCRITEKYVTVGTPPAPHNCPFCKVAIPVAKRERRLARERVEALYLTVVDRDVAADAAGGGE